MFRVVVVTDKENTAIDRLAQNMKPYMDTMEYIIVSVHPKRPSLEQLQRFEDVAKTADIIDFQYFRTAEMLRQRYEWIQDKKTILAHHNPYSIKESDWAGYDSVVANNETIYKDLKEICRSPLSLIPNAVDPYFWTYNDDYQYPKSVIMVANRIESKKGILPVAKACKQLNIKMHLVGSISDPSYWSEVMATEAVEYAQEISDEQLRDLYHKSGIHVCNSVDNFESGTMPILEAIYCGVPVLTRRIGIVPDFETPENLTIQSSDPEDVENIANKLNQMFADKKRLDKQRYEAWMGIKDRNFERRAYAYKRLYRELLPSQPVTVIMPICDRPELTRLSVNAVLEQDYPNLELILVDDSENPDHEFLFELQKMSHIPLGVFQTQDDEGYNLAQARNRGAIEATGEVLVFCDQRIVMESDAISKFMEKIRPKSWLWGSKGVKKDFVENFSCVHRADFITFGMFNERCDRYGALSQETRTRARRQLLQLEYVPEAKATQEGKSSNKWTKKIEIMESKNMLWKMGL